MDPSTAPSRAPGRPRLPRGELVRAALDLVDDEGASALSMRAVASRLGSGTATLYRHFGGREELVAQVIDAVLAEVELDLEHLYAQPWQHSCRLVAVETFATLARHRNIAPLLIERIPQTPTALAARELYLGVLLDNGFPPTLAAKAYATLAHFVLGFAMQMDPHESELSAAVDRDGFARLDPDTYPSTARISPHLPVELADEFEFGLDLLIDGIARHLDTLNGKS